MNEQPIERYGAPASEFSETFVDGMRRRMAVSYHKYGPVEQGVGKTRCLDSADMRIEKYLEDGNTEWLIDAANFVMMEFMFPQHPDAHYRATDSGESPGRVAMSTVAQAKRTSSKHNLDL